MPNLDPSHWTDLLPGGGGSLEQPAFWIAALRIVVINTLLSGDNAVVIAMACRGLPYRQRIWGLVIGAGAAVILLIALTAAVTELIALPYLKIAGGLALLYIAARLLQPEGEDQDEIEAEAHLWRAVRIVIVADLVMSFDNIIAVATAAQGNLGLLAVGLAISIPIIVAGAGLITALLDRFPLLVWIGAAFLGSIAGQAIATDPATLDYLIGIFGETVAHQAEWAAAVAGAALVIVGGGLWRRWHRVPVDAP